jgi:Domain of unknown function (DUF4430)
VRSPIRTPAINSCKPVLCMGVALVCVLLGACGLGAGPAPGGVQLTVTRDFGATVLGSWRAPSVRGQETVMSLLLRNASVSTRYSGGFVQSIDGVAGGRERGQPVDWFYYVNGVEAPLGAASTKVHSGDRIWWDRHDWSQTDHVPAVVGSYPEPFLGGIAGKRLPVRVECAQVGGRACSAVTSQLRASGVPAAVAALGSGIDRQTLRVMVAPWALLKGEPAAAALQSGPGASGVYARFSADGRTLTPLDRDGHAAGALGAASGLIAATAREESAPVWLVTGTDSAGVEAAARAFGRGSLENRFAVTVTAGGAGASLVGGVPR